MPTQKPAPKAGPGRAREVSQARRQCLHQQQRRPPVSSPGGPPAPSSRRRGGAGRSVPPVGTYYCPRCSPRCPHCSGDMCRDGTRAPMTAPHAWEAPPLMGREITFPPGEWPPLSRSSPTQARADRRPDRRPARPSRGAPPPVRPEPPLVALISAAGIIGGQRLPRDVPPPPR